MDYSKIRDIAYKKGVKLKTLANEIGLSEPGFYQMLKNETLKVETLEKIAEVLDVSINYFFNEADPKSEQEIKEAKNGMINHLLEYMALVAALTELLAKLHRKEIDISDIDINALEEHNSFFNNTEEFLLMINSFSPVFDIDITKSKERFLRIFLGKS